MRNQNTQKLVLTSILLAIVIVLQCVSAVVKTGIFQISLVLIPISIGAILLGKKTGALLGIAFGLIVILTGDAAFFMSYGSLSTILIVLSKGTLAGFIVGLVYEKIKHLKSAPIIASMLAPFINTGVFVIGTLLFLKPALEAAGTDGAISNLFIGMIGFNFIIELIVTTILSPAVARITQIGLDKFNIK